MSVETVTELPIDSAEKSSSGSMETSVIKPASLSTWTPATSVKKTRGIGAISSLSGVLISGIINSLVATPAIAADHLIATLEPGQRVQLNSEIQGVVQQVYADLGDRVNKGSVLLQLNRRDYELEAELAKAQTALSQAERKASQKQYQRLKTLYKNGSVSDSQWEEAIRSYDVSRAQVLVDQARLNIAQHTLNKTTLTAPFSGVIAHRMTESGQLLNPGDSAFELVSLNPMKAVFYVLESDYQRIHPGDQLDVELRINGQRYPAEVTRIAPDQNQSRPGYRVEALLENHHMQLKPGFSARIWLPDDGPDNSQSESAPAVIRQNVSYDHNDQADEDD